MTTTNLPNEFQLGYIILHISALASVLLQSACQLITFTDADVFSSVICLCLYKYI